MSFYLKILLWILLLFLEDCCYLHKTVTICFHSHLQSFYMQYLYTYKRLWKIFYSFIFICLNNFFCKVTIKMVAYFFTTIEWQERWTEKNAWTKNEVTILHKKVIKKRFSEIIFLNFYSVAILSCISENSPRRIKSLYIQSYILDLVKRLCWSFFVKVVNSQKSLTIFAKKKCIIDIWQL